MLRSKLHVQEIRDADLRLLPVKSEILRSVRVMQQKKSENLLKNQSAKLEKGTNLSNQSGEALKGIISSIKNVGKYVSEITAAGNEQKQGMSQINIAVGELDSMTQQNAGLVEETASASEEMANQAQELLAMMERFKINDQVKDNTYSQKHKELHLKTTQSSRPAAPAKPAAASERRAPAGNGNPIAPRPGGNATKDKMEEMLTKEGFEEF